MYFPVVALAISTQEPHRNCNFIGFLGITFFLIPLSLFKLRSWSSLSFKKKIVIPLEINFVSEKNIFKEGLFLFIGSNIINKILGPLL